MARTSSLTIVRRAPALDEKVWCFFCLSRFRVTKFVTTETPLSSVIFKTTRNTFCRSRSLSNATFFIFDHVTSIKFKICCCVQNFMKIGWFFSLRYGDISIVKMAAVRHFDIVLPSYETTNKVSVAGRNCLSNFMSIWYTYL